MTADVRTSTTATGTATGIDRWRMPSLVIGIIGIVLSIVGYVIDPRTFFRAYLPSFLFWFSIVAGSLAVLMLQYVTGGEWGLMIRRPLGASARTMLWMVLFFIPILFGMKYLYPWSDTAWAMADENVRQKLDWLNWKRFLLFAALYFALWNLWAWRIRMLSLKFYKDRSPYTELSRRKWAASGLVMIVLTLTFASIDWMLSTEPKFSSTIYGITFVVGCALSALAFVTFFFAQLAHTDAMRGVLKPTHFRDLGNLMLAFVMFYAYTTFSEFLLIWYANLHEEIPHYLVRNSGVWGAVAFSVAMFHFFLPFGLLLMRPIKDNPKTIAIVAVIVIVMRYVVLYWLVTPSWSGSRFTFSWMNLTSLLGIGGIWIWAFIGQLRGQTIIPIHETWVEEAIREGALKVNA